MPPGLFAAKRKMHAIKKSYVNISIVLCVCVTRDRGKDANA